MPSYSQIFAFLFLMLGPFKIIDPFAKITKNASPELTRKIAIRAILFSSIALLIAAFLGETMLKRFDIPIPMLGMSGGIILFLVALLNIIKQFSISDTHDDIIATPTIAMAINPLAFPTIVTPYGIAAVMVFLALSPDLNSKLTIGATTLGIMALNLVVMLIAKYILKPLSLILTLLGAILGIIQVSLGLQIISNALRLILNT